jgi:hypothetical protein
MKTIKGAYFIALFCACALVISSCQSDEEEGIFVMPEILDTVSGVGGVITAMEGDVVLAFPEGAVNEPITFTVNTCLDEEECNYVIKLIKIEPFVKFNAPVTLSLKYDGLLYSGIEICAEACLKAYFWNTEQDFYNHTLANQCNCGIDYREHTINFCICQTGIFAVGLNIE